jgi:coproporphyrinogen III oxidase-like Fe-S oxidoreductase
MLELPPLSLYIHIPWCVKKCPYCDFNSHEAQSDIPESDYIDILCQDFDRDYEHCDARPLQSIFIGGGTPSLFGAKSFEKILTHIRSKASLSGECDERQLKNLGRIHSADESKRAIDFARRAGFDNFNLDLMHGLPGQSVSDALRDLQTAIDFDPLHISWYQLTIEPNTVFHARPPTLPEEPILNSLEDAGLALLANSGYHRYEVSAFSKNGCHSRHNLNYWEFGDYLGIGAGAHGKITQT